MKKRLMKIEFSNQKNSGIFQHLKIFGDIFWTFVLVRV